jgi:hypothetical protein
MTEDGEPCPPLWRQAPRCIQTTYVPAECHRSQRPTSGTCWQVSFDELFDLVNALIRPIPKIGELAVYDTAFRIGARFGLEHERVYVHAGTHEGARALGFDPRWHTIEMSELPAFERLTASEAEDVLCRYKSKLGH